MLVGFGQWGHTPVLGGREKSEVEVAVIPSAPWLLRALYLLAVSGSGNSSPPDPPGPRSVDNRAPVARGTTLSFVATRCESLY